MNPSQKASLPAGLELELPVLTDVVEELTLPVLSEESPFELPDFDFSSELDEMASTLPADAGAIELEIPAELPLEDVLDIGPVPRPAEPVVDFSNLPSLDLEVASLDELALDEVLPGLIGNVSPPVVNTSTSGIERKDEPFEFVLSPVDAAAAPVASGPSEVAQRHDAGFDIPELTTEWSEPTVSAKAEEIGSAQPEPVESQSAGPLQVQDDGFGIPELTMEWSEEPVVTVEAEETQAASPQPVELPSAEAALTQDGDFDIPELTMEWPDEPVSAEAEKPIAVSPQPVELPSTAPLQVQDDGFDIPELTMEWPDEPVVSLEAEEAEAVSPQPVELPSTAPVLAHDDDLDIPELNMEWVASPVSAEVEEVGVASPEPVEPPSPAIELSSLTGDDTVQVETSTVVAEPWTAAVSTLDTELADELAEPAATEAPCVESETAATPFDMQAESADVEGREAMQAVQPAPVMQRIDIESLPTGVLGGGVGPEPEAGGIHDQLPWGRTEYGSDADESPEAVAAALSELAALLEPVSEVIQPEPAVLAVSGPGAGEELPVTEVPSLASGADAVGGVDETTLSVEPDNGDQPAQPESMTVGPEFLSPAATVEQAAPVHAEPAIESEGIQGGVTPEVPMLLEETGSTDVPQEPLGMENDEVGVLGVGGASDSGESEAAALDDTTSDLDEMHAFTSIEPVEVVAPFLPEESGQVAEAAPQPDAVASTGLLEPSIVSAMPAAAEVVRMPEEAKAQSCVVVDEQVLIDSLTQKILPRMKVELSLWLQDALEMQARQMLAGVMHQLKEDYEMLFNETLRESLRQAITEIGRDEREGES